MKTLKGIITDAFDSWLQEPAAHGSVNQDHLNTRTTDCCEVAFNAGWDAAIKSASYWLERQGANSTEIVELEKLLPNRNRRLSDEE